MNQPQIEIFMDIYQSIIRKKYSWLLLQYKDNANLHQLFLYSKGAEGLEELRSRLNTNTNEIRHAVYREDSKTSSRFVLITHIPVAVSAIQRARALVNARHLATLFEECQVLMTVEDPCELTQASVRKALLGEGHLINMDRSSSEFVEASPEFPANNSLETSHHSTLKSNKAITNILRRKRIHEPTFIDVKGKAPPPPPPKAKVHTRPPYPPWQVPMHMDPLDLHTAGTASNNGKREIQAVSEISHTYSQASDEGNDMPTPVGSSSPKTRSPYMPLQGKWVAAMVGDPAERARLRLQAQVDRQREEEQAIEEERHRQAELKQMKEEALKQSLEEEAQRKRLLEEELKHAAAERRRKERIEEAEEERLRGFLELRKRVEKERRLEERQKMEKWRREQISIEEKARRLSQEAKMQQAEERMKQIHLAQARLGQDMGQKLGWVTIQTNELLVWKRRYFRLHGNTIYLYRNAKEMQQPGEEIRVGDQLKSVKEWNDGYEELEAIPHSFVFEFMEQGKNWMLFTDTEEDKYMILGFTYTAAGCRDSSCTTPLMAGLISPKPVSYLQQHGQYNPYARGLSAYSETPPIGVAPLAHPVPHQPVGQYMPNPSAVVPLGIHEEGRIHSLVIELLDPNTREGALLELSKKREQYEDLALVLWHSFGIMPALLQEIVSVYPLLSPPNLTAHVSNRVCNALALLQCVASHTETRQLFLNAHIPLFLYPFLNTTSKTRPFEYLRLTSLGVIGALVKQNDNNTVIHFLLSTEIIPLCLRIMETGSELSKTVAIFIVQKILLDETGLTYICHTYERFYAVGTVLSNMVNQLVETQAVRLLKHVVRCYLRLSDNLRAREALRACLPEPLRDQTFSNLLKGDMVTKRCLTTLLNNLNEP
ncbi:hypothetical protein AX17_007250 [Amanita inopinata Kibby_2008]|nr:hypothetical protein AX17_007250 [Amanita inopinata Kibby_2008]